MLKGGEDHTYCFDVSCVGLVREMCLGQAVSAEVRVRTNSEQSTINHVPEILLDHFKVDIVALTTVEMDQHWSSPMRMPDTGVIHTLHGVATPPGPFTKAHDYTKVVNTQPLVDVPSTFKIGKISRAYKLRVELQFTVAGQSRQVRRDVPVTIHPPVGGVHREAQAGPAGPSTAMEEEQLPAYDEAAAPPPFVAEKFN